MRGRDRRVTRLLVAGLLAVSAFCVSVAPSAAAPSVSESKSELEAARAKLGELQQKFEQLVENYDYAAVQLADTTQKLDAAQTEMDRANTAAQEARDVLSQRAVTAYEGGMGSSLEVLLGAGDFTQLSDRLEFLSHMAANDADLAQQAELSEDQAHALAQDLAALKADEQAKKEALDKAMADVKDNIGQQEALVDQYELQYSEALTAQRAAEKAAAQVSTGGSGSTSSGDGGGYVPPSSGAAGAVQAALSMVGKPYVWGAASPSVGFDCSGLTMWAWAQVGVSLPHSSAAQYSAVPHVSKDQLQPGDLLFFYSPISHVGMYIGGGQMVHSSGSGVGTSGLTYYWKYFVGAGRPG